MDVGCDDGVDNDDIFKNIPRSSLEYIHAFQGFYLPRYLSRYLEELKQVRSEEEMRLATTTTTTTSTK